jgi:hypothetical protein
MGFPINPPDEREYTGHVSDVLHAAEEAAKLARKAYDLIHKVCRHHKGTQEPRRMFHDCECLLCNALGMMADGEHYLNLIEEKVNKNPDCQEACEE